MHQLRLGVTARSLLIVILFALAAAAPAGACCCTCQNSEKCFPTCGPDISDFASCNGNCLDAGCGPAAPCPNPAAGEGCATDEVSCFDLGPITATGAPAASATGLVSCALVLAAIGTVSLLRRRAGS